MADGEEDTRMGSPMMTQRDESDAESGDEEFTGPAMDKVVRLDIENLMGEFQISLGGLIRSFEDPRNSGWATMTRLIDAWKYMVRWYNDLKVRDSRVQEREILCAKREHDKAELEYFRKQETKRCRIVSVEQAKVVEDASIALNTSSSKEQAQVVEEDPNMAADTKDHKQTLIGSAARARPPQGSSISKIQTALHDSPPSRIPKLRRTADAAQSCDSKSGQKLDRAKAVTMPDDSGRVREFQALHDMSTEQLLDLGNDAPRSNNELPEIAGSGIPVRNKCLKNEVASPGSKTARTTSAVATAPADSFTQTGTPAHVMMPVHESTIHSPLPTMTPRHIDEHRIQEETRDLDAADNAMLALASSVNLFVAPPSPPWDGS